jgi:hypothetical protein
LGTNAYKRHLLNAHQKSQSETKSPAKHLKKHWPSANLQKTNCLIGNLQPRALTAADLIIKHQTLAKSKPFKHPMIVPVGKSAVMVSNALTLPAKVNEKKIFENPQPSTLTATDLITKHQTSDAAIQSADPGDVPEPGVSEEPQDCLGEEGESLNPSKSSPVSVQPIQIISPSGVTDRPVLSKPLQHPKIVPVVKTPTLPAKVNQKKLFENPEPIPFIATDLITKHQTSDLAIQSADPGEVPEPGITEEPQDCLGEDGESLNPSKSSPVSVQPIQIISLSGVTDRQVLSRPLQHPKIVPVRKSAAILSNAPTLPAKVNENSFPHKQLVHKGNWKCCYCSGSVIFSSFHDFSKHLREAHQYNKTVVTMVNLTSISQKDQNIIQSKLRQGSLQCGHCVGVKLKSLYEVQYHIRKEHAQIPHVGFVIENQSIKLLRQTQKQDLNTFADNTSNENLIVEGHLDRTSNTASGSATFSASITSSASTIASAPKAGESILKTIQSLLKEVQTREVSSHKTSNAVRRKKNGKPVTKSRSDCQTNRCIYCTYSTFPSWEKLKDHIFNVHISGYTLPSQRYNFTNALCKLVWTSKN